MQDANVRLIRELREEIDRLKSMLLSFEMVCEPSESLRHDGFTLLLQSVLERERFLCWRFVAEVQYGLVTLTF